MSAVQVGTEALPVFAFEEATDADRLSDRATDRLRSLIITLHLEPGGVLDEAALAQRLNCGRTPVREAIQRLADERLVTILPRRAAAVSPITVTDLQQIYEARLTLEPEVARLAALRATTAQLAELERNVSTLLDGSGAQSTVGVVHADFAFHHGVARAAENRYLCDSVCRILGAAMRLTFLAHKHGQPSQETHAEHSLILRGLTGRDGSAAEQEMRRHITRAKERSLHRL